MEGLELLSFQIIANVGEAKSSLFQAMKAAREERFEEAEDFIKTAEESLGKAHEFHVEMLQKESEEEPIKVTLLLMHAEDQMMTTEMLKDVTSEMLLMHKKYSQNNK